MIFRIQLLETLAACMIFICACKKNNDETGTKTTISACNTASLEAVIGTQTWTTTNLNVDKFRIKNKSCGISGVLCSGEGVFLQVLEGERSAVSKLFAIICRDNRHTDIELLHYEEIKECF